MVSTLWFEALPGFRVQAMARPATAGSVELGATVLLSDGASVVCTASVTSALESTSSAFAASTAAVLVTVAPLNSPLVVVGTSTLTVTSIV